MSNGSSHLTSAMQAPPGFLTPLMQQHLSIPGPFTAWSLARAGIAVTLWNHLLFNGGEGRHFRQSYSSSTTSRHGFDLKFQSSS
jgi:hypothetical protein